MDDERGCNVNWANNLRCAIVEKAVCDYEKALKGLKRWDESNQTDLRKRYGHERLAGECEAFFRSKWFYFLSNIDGEKAINAIRERVYGAE